MIPSFLWFAQNTLDPMPSVTRLINKTAVKDYTLACIEAERPHLATKLTRISESYYVRVEARLRRIILSAGAALTLLLSATATVAVAPAPPLLISSTTPGSPAEAVAAGVGGGRGSPHLPALAVHLLQVVGAGGGGGGGPAGALRPALPVSGGMQMRMSCSKSGKEAGGKAGG